MEFTGERYMPEVAGGVRYEHLHRYLFCRQYVKNKVVLDIASGEGYGSRHLSEEAARVHGVDIDAEAIAHAKSKYVKDNLSFHLGSCEAIPLEDSSVDVVVSFETIEHHDKHDEMMSEIKRVLKSDGVLIISSPNKYVHQDLNKNVNPFHIRELYEEDFKALTKSYFKHCRFLEQKVISGSAITVNGGGPGHTIVCPPSAEFRPSKDVIPSIHNPYYFMAICSDREDGNGDIEASIYLEENDNLLFDFIAALNDVNKNLVERSSTLKEQSKQLEEQRLAYNNVIEEAAQLKLRLARIDGMRSVRLLRYIKRLFF